MNQDLSGDGSSSAGRELLDAEDSSLSPVKPSRGGDGNGYRQKLAMASLKAEAAAGVREWYVESKSGAREKRRPPPMDTSIEDYKEDDDEMED